jgi:hypothetical protein
MTLRDAYHRMLPLLVCAGLAATSGCSTSAGGTTVMRHGLPLRITFADCSDAPIGTEGGATSTCDHAEFRVTVKHPSATVSPQQSYIFRFDQPTAGLAVSAEVRLDRGDASSQVLGVSCVASGYQRRAQEYIFGINDRYAAIMRHDEADATIRKTRYLEQIAYTRLSGISLSATTRIDGECATLSGGTTLLVMRVNGREVLREYTRARYPRFVAASLCMFTATGASFAFDNLSARAESRVG